MQRRLDISTTVRAVADTHQSTLYVRSHVITRAKPTAATKSAAPRCGCQLVLADDQVIAQRGSSLPSSTHYRRLLLSMFLHTSDILVLAEAKIHKNALLFFLLNLLMLAFAMILSCFCFAFVMILLLLLCFCHDFVMRPLRLCPMLISLSRTVLRHI